MRKAAKDLRFEDAAHARDMMRRYQEMEISLS
jgi:excinuclease UvrABC helicase subunit UvrB